MDDSSISDGICDATDLKRWWIPPCFLWSRGNSKSMRWNFRNGPEQSLQNPNVPTKWPKSLIASAASGQLQVTRKLEAVPWVIFSMSHPQGFIRVWSFHRMRTHTVNMCCIMHMYIVYIYIYYYILWSLSLVVLSLLIILSLPLLWLWLLLSLLVLLIYHYHHYYVYTYVYDIASQWLIPRPLPSLSFGGAGLLGRGRSQALSLGTCAIVEGKMVQS